MLGHIVTKEQDVGGVSFGMSRPATEETYMCTVYEIENDKGILWTLFDIRHEQLFTVNDLWKCQSTLGEGKAISKYLYDKTLYVAQINGCQKINDIHAKHGPKEDIAKLNAVAKALKASPMKALRDFQRRQFGTPPKLLGTHYTEFCIVLGKIIAHNY